ncbi:hypothetical protein [Kineococcus xinjiangensis]|uniref:hypothetical protein n=1 Tax=Kineococcus xinjiangensis TaxID=512762 RepID=UPI000CECA7CB|nr:hypothetical protein [Kineococcus xinjiangensis]
MQVTALVGVCMVGLAAVAGSACLVAGLGGPQHVCSRSPTSTTTSMARSSSFSAQLTGTSLSSWSRMLGCRIARAADGVAECSLFCT